MEYRLNLYTTKHDFIDLKLKLINTDVDQYTLNVGILTDEYKNKIFDHRREGYQLILNSLIPLNDDDLVRVYNEIKGSVEDVMEVIPSFVDIQSEFVCDWGFDKCYEVFDENILCSVYNDNDLRAILDFNDENHIKRSLNENIVKIDPKQEVFRVSNIRKKDIFPSSHCVKKSGMTYIGHNFLDLKHTERTLLVVGQNYISLSPHVGYLEYDDLVIWMVSEHILVQSVWDRTRDFDGVQKYMCEIDTTNLLEYFQEVINELGFVHVSIVPNKSLYSVESGTVIFIGDFPGDAVTPTIHKKYLQFKADESSD